VHDLLFDGPMGDNWRVGLLASWGVLVVLIKLDVRVHNASEGVLLWGVLWVACTYYLAHFEIVRKKHTSDTHNDDAEARP
jgi:hypothetical protein